jgi:hypothetical protein
MKTMNIYNELRAVPQEAQKTIQAGKLKGFTDINPMWRIKTLTEVFGPCGRGWWTDDVKMWTENAGGETAAFVSLNLYVVFDGELSAPIFGIGGSKLSGKGVGDGVNDEAYKMAYTDALGIACKALGMAADIYFSKDCRDNVTKYTAPQAPATKAVQYSPVDEHLYWQLVEKVAKGERGKNGEDLTEWWKKKTNASKIEVALFETDVENAKQQLIKNQ